MYQIKRRYGHHQGDSLRRRIMRMSALWFINIPFISTDQNWRTRKQAHAEQLKER